MASPVDRRRDPDGPRPRRSLLRILGDLALGLAVALGAYGGLALLIASRSLPPGACLFDRQRPVFLAALILSAISLVLSFLESKRKA